MPLSVADILITGKYKRYSWTEVVLELNPAVHYLHGHVIHLRTYIDTAITTTVLYTRARRQHICKHFVNMAHNSRKIDIDIIITLIENDGKDK